MRVAMVEELEGSVAVPKFTSERTLAVVDWRARRRRLISATARALSGSLVLTMALVAVPAAFAQLGGGLPRTAITSDDSGAVGNHTHPGSLEGRSLPIEHGISDDKRHEGGTLPLHFHVAPAKARLTLKVASFVYEQPAKSSKALARLPAAAYVDVSGSTHYFLRVRLNHGRVGYVPISAVNLITSVNQIHRLASNAAVLSAPALQGAKLSEVHRGHDVHIVGVTLNYVRIRMRSGLEGFIPVSALE